jgi:hypothetical protein
LFGNWAEIEQVRREGVGWEPRGQKYQIHVRGLALLMGQTKPMIDFLYQ